MILEDIEVLCVPPSSVVCIWQGLAYHQDGWCSSRVYQVLIFQQAV